MSATTVGQIGLDLVVNRKKFDQQMNGIGKVAKKVGAALASAFAVKKIVDFGKECVNLASDLEEVQNVVDVTFPSMTTQVDKFAKNAASAFGLSETMAKKYTGTFGAMAKAFGFSEQQAYDMSATLTGLAGDVASFYNLTQDEAYTKLKSVFTGETESLKELGVVMTQTALDSYALANGYGKTTSAMSEAEKVALRYAFVQDQLAAASGDFIRTSGSWANQVRILSLQFDNLKTSIGSGLIAALTPVLQMINTLLAKLQVLADAFKSFMTGIFGDAGGMKSVSAAAGSAAASSGEIASNTSAAAESAKKASKYLAGFDEITKVSTDNASGSGGGGSAGGIGTMGSASGSGETTGAIDKARTKMDEFLGYLNGKFAPIFEQSLAKFQKPISDFKDLFKKAFEDLCSLGDPLINYFDTSFIPFLQQFIITSSDILSGLLDSFNLVFGDLWNMIIFPFVEKLTTVALPILTDVGTEVLALADEAFLEIKSLFDQIWNDAVSPTLSRIQKIWEDLWTVVQEFWEEWGEPIFNGIRDAINNTGDTLRNIWDTIVRPVFDTLMQVVDEVWNEHLRPLVKNFLDFCGTLIDGALRIYNKFILPLVNWFVSQFGPGISEAFSSLIRDAGDFLSFIADTINGVINFFSGLVTFITQVFSGDWEGALGTIHDVTSDVWNNILSLFSTGGEIFSGVVDGIASVFKAIVNTMLSGINKVIASPFNTINGLLNRIRSTSVLGFKPFSGLWSYNPLPVPQIPMLAHGGYVKPNTPQLAMIGDNRHQGEVVAPEDKLLEMAIKAAKMASGGDPEVLALLKEIIALLKELLDDPNDTVLYIGDEEIARANSRGSSKLKRRYATTKVKVGD